MVAFQGNSGIAGHVPGMHYIESKVGRGRLLLNHKPLLQLNVERELNNIITTTEMAFQRNSSIAGNVLLKVRRGVKVTCILSGGRE